MVPISSMDAAFTPHLLSGTGIGYTVPAPIGRRIPMSSTDTLILAPFVAAFLVFVFRFYGREGAPSVASPTFLCAVGTVALAGAYLVLGVFGYLPDNGTLIFGVVGLVLLALSIVRLFVL